ILNVDWRNNQLVAAQNVGIASDMNVHAQWYEIGTAGAAPALVQQGTVAAGEGIDTYMPAVALAPDGSLGMTYLESSAVEDRSMYVTGWTPAEPPGTMEPAALVKAGEQYYQGTRAGDFSGIMVDPTSGQSFWAVNEYAIATPDLSLPNWGTWIAEFQLGGPRLFDFNMNANGPTAPGYLGVLPTDLYTSAQGYGWQTPPGGKPPTGFDIGKPNDPLLEDGNTGTDDVFLADVPNADYVVTITLGDALYSHTQMKVVANGALVLSGLLTGAGQFVSKSFPVSVNR